MVGGGGGLFSGGLIMKFYARYVTGFQWPLLYSFGTLCHLN